MSYGMLTHAARPPIATTWTEFREKAEKDNDLIAYIKFKESLVAGGKRAGLQVTYIHINPHSSNATHCDLPPWGHPFWEGVRPNLTGYFYIPERVAGAEKQTPFIHPFSSEISVRNGVLRTALSAPGGGVAFEDILDITLDPANWRANGWIRSKKHPADYTLRDGIIYKWTDLVMDVINQQAPAVGVKGHIVDYLSLHPRR